MVVEVREKPYSILLDIHPPIQEDLLSPYDRDMHTYLVLSHQLRLKRQYGITSMHEARSGERRSVPFNPNSYAQQYRRKLTYEVNMYRQKLELPEDWKERVRIEQEETERLTQMGFPPSWQGKQPKTRDLFLSYQSI